MSAYIFGSALDPNAAWSDIDILVLCQNESDGQITREALENLLAKYPIDLLIMSHDEESEFDFVRSERCVNFTALQPLVAA